MTAQQELVKELMYLLDIPMDKAEHLALLIMRATDEYVGKTFAGKIRMGV
jgi:hypothetical protein